MISYSTNWMGPVGMWWFHENGYTKVVTRVLEKDSLLTNAKAVDTIDYEEVTEHWYGGRIDVYGLDSDEFYNGKDEMGLPIMDGPSYWGFSEWLENFKTKTVWSLDELVAEYEKTHDKIRWHSEQTN